MKDFYLGYFTLFDVLEDEKKQALKVLEESAELVEAVKNYKNSSWVHRNTQKQREEMLSEAADIAQALANLLAVEKVTSQEWQNAIEDCTMRNINRGRIIIKKGEM